MRFLRYGPEGHERPAVLTDDGRARDLTPLTADIDGAFLAVDGIDRVRDRLGELPEVDLAGARLGPPVATPRSLVCIGLNYADHARETGAEPPATPVVFSKAVSTIVGPDDAIVVPPGSTTTDYEVELAVVIGRRAYRLPGPEAAADVVAGYALSNDVSEREYQFERGGGQWYLGKSCPTFNPLGPWLVPAGDVPDVGALALSLTVNGEPRQSSTTAELIFGIDHLVWYLSQHLILEPGDVVNTGTPGGVALGRGPDAYLTPGDVVEASITHLGTQRQQVVAG